MWKCCRGSCCLYFIVTIVGRAVFVLNELPDLADRYFKPVLYVFGNRLQKWTHIGEQKGPTWSGVKGSLGLAFSMGIRPMSIWANRFVGPWPSPFVAG